MNRSFSDSYWVCFPAADFDPRERILDYWILICGLFNLLMQRANCMVKNYMWIFNCRCSGGYLLSLSPSSPRGSCSYFPLPLPETGGWVFLFVWLVFLVIPFLLDIYWEGLIVIPRTKLTKVCRSSFDLVPLRIFILRVVHLSLQEFINYRQDFLSRSGKTWVSVFICLTNLGLSSLPRSSSLLWIQEDLFSVFLTFICL